jgi:hypothetical protein
MIDTVRDADAGRVLPQMVPALLDLLKSGEVAFQQGRKGISLSSSLGRDPTSNLLQRRYS